jgi:hypothetical protein
MSTFAWRVDRVARAMGGEVLSVEEGKAMIDYDKARSEFDAAFFAASPGSSVRLWRAVYDARCFTLAWVLMREGWAGKRSGTDG